MVDKDGLEHYVVGGYVRDLVMGVSPKDKDFVVVGETPKSMEERGFKPVEAEAFPVFLHPDTRNEYALARQEVKQDEGHKGFDCFTDDVSLEEDLERRDFTMNAIAMTPDGEEFIDPFDGIKHIVDWESIQPVNEDAFAEDPLRALRLCRFHARYPWMIASDPALIVAMDARTELDSVPRERVTEELRKALVEAERPGRFLHTASRIGALHHINETLPEMELTPAGPPEHHMEGDTLTHTRMVLNELSERRQGPVVVFLAAMFHDVGKVATDEDILPSHHGHEKAGVKVLEERVFDGPTKLVLSNDEQRFMRFAARQHRRFTRIPEMNAGKVISLVEQMESLNTTFAYRRMADITAADWLGRFPRLNPIRVDGPGIPEVIAEVEMARRTINDIGGHEVVEKRGKTLADYDGEAIGQMIKQDRIEEFKRMRKRSRRFMETLEEE